MHGCTTNTDTGRIEEVGVNQVCRDFFKVTLTAFDDLTAGQSSRVDTTVAVTFGVGSLVWLRWCIEHGVSELDVPDTVSSLCSVGRGDNLSDRTVRLTLFCEWRMCSRVCLTWCPVTKDENDVFIGNITDFFELYIWVHLFAPVLGYNRLARTILWSICHIFISPNLKFS